jgi:preprotein translocase subunit YajC
LAHDSLFRNRQLQVHPRQGEIAMSLKTGDRVRTNSGQVGSVVSIDSDRTVVVMLEDHGARFQPSDLKLIGADGAATGDLR